MSDTDLRQWYISNKRVSNVFDKIPVISLIGKPGPTETSTADVIIYGPYGVDDPNRFTEYGSELSTEQPSVCPNLYEYLHMTLNLDDSYEYRAEMQIKTPREGDVDVIVGAASVFRGETPERTAAFQGGDFDPRDLKLNEIARASRDRVADVLHEFKTSAVKGARVSGISHIHAFCGNTKMNGVGRRLMAAIEKGESTISGLLVLWATDDVVNFYTTLQFERVPLKDESLAFMVKRIAPRRKRLSREAVHQSGDDARSLQRPRR
jgi:hypothetical protein